MFVEDAGGRPHRSPPRSRASALDPVEAMIDLALEKDMDRFLLPPIANENQESP